MLSEAPRYGDLSENTIQKALATIMRRVPAVSAAQIAGILARSDIYVNPRIFLGSNEMWKKSLSESRTPVTVVSTGKIGIYGTMDGVKASADSLEDLDLYNPSQKSEDRSSKQFTSLAQESEGFFGSSALYIHMTESGGGISQMEVRMAALNSLLSDKPLTVRVDVPEKPKEINGYTGNIWRSRMMIIADMVFLKALFGDKLPVYLSVNNKFERQLPKKQDWIKTYIDDISTDNQQALTHIRNLNLTPPNPPNLFLDVEPANKIVFSGSVNEDQTRRALLDKLGQSFPDMPIQNTFIPDFSANLPITRIEENNMVGGLHITSAKGVREAFHPPLVNVIQATQSFGDLSQATMSFLLSVIHGIYTLLYLPEKENANRGSDLFTFQSHVRRLIEMYPSAARHIRIAQTPDELVSYIKTIKKHTQPSQSQHHSDR